MPDGFRLQRTAPRRFRKAEPWRRGSARAEPHRRGSCRRGASLRLPQCQLATAGGTEGDGGDARPRERRQSRRGRRSARRRGRRARRQAQPTRSRSNGRHRRRRLREVALRVLVAERIRRTAHAEMQRTRTRPAHRLTGHNPSERRLHIEVHQRHPSVTAFECRCGRARPHQLARARRAHHAPRRRSRSPPLGAIRLRTVNPRRRMAARSGHQRAESGSRARTYVRGVGSGRGVTNLVQSRGALAPDAAATRRDPRRRPHPPRARRASPPRGTGRA